MTNSLGLGRLLVLLCACSDLLPVIAAQVTNCQDIIDRNPRSSNGEYMIDPDGSGPMPSTTKISCEFSGRLGITVVHHNTEGTKRVKGKGEKQWVQQYTYANKITLDEILKIIEKSTFCYQEVNYECKKVDLWRFGDWLGGDDRRHRTSGASKTNSECGCAMLSACADTGAKCNCNGADEDRNDRGKMFDYLPVREMALGGVTSSSNLKVAVGPVRCAQKQFEIPRDCTEAKKNFYYEHNDVVLIDVDGPNKNEEAFYVHCDVESQDHVGIIQVPHKFGYNGRMREQVYESVTSAGSIAVEYALSQDKINLIMERNSNCTQEIGYQCTNSGLLTGGGGTWSSGDGTERTYWGSSEGRSGTCVCGTTGQCDEPEQMCNCNIKDGRQREDFGVLREKSHLPVASLKFTEIGGGKSGAYYLGWLSCADFQFRIEPSCQGYRNLGHNKSHSFLIDPDGPTQAGVAPYPVHCDFWLGRTVGVTIISGIAPENNGVVDYRGLRKEDLTALTWRSVYCTQDITYHCRQSPIHSSNDNSLVYWDNVWGRKRRYFHGISGTKCECYNSCVGGGLCNCDANQAQELEDSGTLHNDDDLPVKKLYGQSGGRFTLGPLKCYELWPSCHHLLHGYSRVTGQIIDSVKPGSYAIDPDGALGVEPYQVACNNDDTLIEVAGGGKISYLSKKISNPESAAGPMKKCHTISYGVSTAQLRALTVASGWCSQYITYTCRHSSVSTHVSWKNREGKPMLGWAGNLGGPECQCGEINRCDGGLDGWCNCDMNDGEQRADEGLLIDKRELPVSEVCMGYDEKKPGQEREATLHIERFRCRHNQADILFDCQRIREQEKKDVSKTFLVDSDASDNTLPPYIAYCEMIVDPPVGVTHITPLDELCIGSPGGSEEIGYNRASITTAAGLRDRSVYCRQDVFYKCSGSGTVSLSDLPGYHDYDDNPVSYDREQLDEADCVGGTCVCDSSNDNFFRVRIWDNGRLPITKILLPARGVSCVKVHPLKCFTIYKHCQEVQDRGQSRFNPLKRRYGIDPDRKKGVKYFGVRCNLKDYSPIAITQVIHDQSSTTVTSSKNSQTVTYLDASIRQIRELISVSKWCRQEVNYKCNKVPLLNDLSPPYAQLSDYTGTLLESWAGSDAEGVKGCACNVFGVCPGTHTCRCDAGIEYEEGGLLVNKDTLPIIGITVGGPLSSGASAELVLEPLECAEYYYGLNTSCINLKNAGFPTGEYLIQPNPLVEPILVTCNMNPTDLEDQCSSGPCQHNGQCIDGEYKYTCACATGYIGIQCEQDNDECASNPCGVGGSCADGINLFTCTCYEGYNGTLCEPNLDECASTPCKNGGTCVDKNKAFECICVDGYTGPSCRGEVDECESFPCKNGGTCTQGLGFFSCECPEDYGGATCEPVTDEPPITPSTTTIITSTTIPKTATPESNVPGSTSSTVSRATPAGTSSADIDDGNTTDSTQRQGGDEDDLDLKAVQRMAAEIGGSIAGAAVLLIGCTAFAIWFALKRKKKKRREIHMAFSGSMLSLSDEDDNESQDIKEKFDEMSRVTVETMPDGSDNAEESTKQVESMGNATKEASNKELSNTDSKQKPDSEAEGSTKEATEKGSNKMSNSANSSHGNSDKGLFEER